MQPLTIPGPPELQAIHHKASDKAIVILAHGFTGDKDEWGRFEKMSQSLEEKSISSIRFDFAGSGESEAQPITVEGQVKDLQNVIEFTKTLGYTSIGILGLSLGGLCALKAWNPEIKTMVLWAPVSHPRELLPDNLPTSQGVYKIKNPTGKIYSVDVKMPDEMASIDTSSFSSVQCPTLLLHGDKDEDVPVEDSQELITHLSNESKLEILEGDDHDLQKSLPEVIQMSCEWFENFLEN